MLAQPFDARSLRTTGSAQSIAESVSCRLQLSQRLAMGCCCINEPPRHNSPGWIPKARNFRRSVIRVTCRRLISLPMAGTQWSPCSRPDKKIRSSGCTTLTRAPPVHSLLAKGTISILPGLPTVKQVAFASTRGGNQEDIYVKPVGGGSSEQLVLSDEGNKEPDRWSADGRYILFDYTSKKTKATDIWALPMFGDRKPFPVVQSPAIDYYGMFSRGRKVGGLRLG